MAAPVASKIILPDDSSNAGKKVRTQTRVVGADTVHEHFVIPISQQKINGLFHFCFTLYTVAAAAQNGTSAAIGWLQNPSTAGVNARLRFVQMAHTNTVATAIDHTSAPRIAVQRITHTDGWSGATLNVAKRATADSNNIANIRTATTGTTVTLAATQLVWSSLVPGADITTSGVLNIQFGETWRPVFEDEYVVIAPGEGIVIYQIDAGTTSDQRKTLVKGCWDEVDIT
jgi:hypothetical protein